MLEDIVKIFLYHSIFLYSIERGYVLWTEISMTKHWTVSRLFQISIQGVLVNSIGSV